MEQRTGGHHLVSALLNENERICSIVVCDLCVRP